MKEEAEEAIAPFLESMEAWLEEEEGKEGLPPPEELALWNSGFQHALAQGGQGPGWEATVQRAHVLAGRIQKRVAECQIQLDLLRRAMDQQTQGERALKGYGAVSRPNY